MSHAPGLRGMPDSGQRSSAATSASWASSSAMPTSPTMRVSPAMTFADSMRQTASMARWMSGDGSVIARQAGTQQPQQVGYRCAEPGLRSTVAARRIPVPARRGLPRAQPRGLGPKPLLGLPQLRRERGPEVLGFEHLANLDDAVAERHPLDPLDGLVLGLHLDQPEAGHQLLGLRERP